MSFNWEGYHAETESLSCSQFKVYCRSPREYFETFIEKKWPKKKKSKVMETGTACHAILLEKQHIDDVVRRYDRRCKNCNGGLIGAPAEAFRLKIAPVIAVKDDQYDQIKIICDKVMQTEIGDVLRSPVKFEKRLDAIIDGVACRCKPDIHTIIDQTAIVYDLKFTERITPEDWKRTAKQMQYYFQDAHYSRIMEEKYNLPTVFRFVCCETKYPYRVEYRWYDDRSREIAREFHSKKLLEFAESKRTNTWVDRWESTVEVSPWEVGANDDGEMVAFEG